MTPEVTEPAATDDKAGGTDMNTQCISNGPIYQRGQPGRWPDSNALISPEQLLFDDQQLRRFQELYAQAAWLYPGGRQLPLPPPPFQNSIARPLFLE